MEHQGIKMKDHKYYEWQDKQWIEKEYVTKYSNKKYNQKLIFELYFGYELTYHSLINSVFYLHGYQERTFGKSNNKLYRWKNNVLR